MSSISVFEATTPDEVATVAGLLRDYLLWMRRRYRTAPSIIDLYFDPHEWESELSDLAGHFGPPFGAIVFALADGVPAGCVLMRGIAEETCEMKRLFVRPAFQGLGVARVMVGLLLQLACRRNYSLMRLETGALQTEALALYRTLGFKPANPYLATHSALGDIGRYFETTPCRLSAA